MQEVTRQYQGVHGFFLLVNWRLTYQVLVFDGKYSGLGGKNGAQPKLRTWLLWK
jgi:hypothetical protein